MRAVGESCNVTGISDGTDNVLWYAEQCLLRLQNHLAATESEAHQAQQLR